MLQRIMRAVDLFQEQVANAAWSAPLSGADPDSIRTAYKRLALKWFPEKYGNANEIFKKFYNITLAYKRLTTDNEHTTVQNKEEVYNIYFKVVLNKELTEANYKAHTTNGGLDEESEEESEEESDDEDGYCNHFHKTDRYFRQDGLNNNNARKHLTPEEIERNAQELISEEEKEKRRAEKRRAKKKRQRQKKKAEKEQKKDDETSNKSKSKQKDSGSQSKRDKKGRDSGSEAEDFDQSAAFFTQVVSKKKKGGTVPEPSPSTTQRQPRAAAEARLNGSQEEKVEDLDPVILRSRQLAREGNLMASKGHYQSAIDLFTDACKLDPSDFRFFGNRSYCYDRMQQYEKALKDADKAITLAPDWPKGYFRKGRALAGLKLYSDAEQAFMQVLKLDKNCEDAMQELIRVRTHQLTEMGFTLAQAEHAITQYVTVQQALDSLLAGVVAENSLANEIYESDEEDYDTLVNTHTPSVPVQPAVNHRVMPDLPAAAQPPQITTATYHSTPGDTKMDPKNPGGHTALWVGNVLPEVTQAKLLQLFSKYGPVTSIRMLPEKYCAFVNFKTKEAAGQAMNRLQSSECSGQKLLIKFPDNPINGSVVLRKGAQQPTQQQASKNIKVDLQSEASNSKQSGPVNGDECYFWRTTGCQFGKTCRWKHTPESKGKDRKPWQK